MSAGDLHVVSTGEGRAVVLLHGLTATHRYVVMGSRALERSGHRVVSYDARGHGESAPGLQYDYAVLADDLGRVLDDHGVERAVLAGASMGAHTLLRYALQYPDRVAGAVVITPAFHEDADPDLERWDRLAAGLRAGGVEGFVEAYGQPSAVESWQETLLTVLRQRMSQHVHPDAVADALEQVPRSRPYDSIAALRALTSMPVTIVADRDEPDPGHPLWVGEAYAETIPGARLIVEEVGKSPIAWQGGQLSKLITEVASEAAW